MTLMSQQAEQRRQRYRSWLGGVLVFLALFVVARFVLEIAAVPRTVTRFVSSSAAVFLAAIYLGAVALLRGVTKFVQLILPAIVLAAWTQGWVILATLISGVFRLERSHFAEAEDYGNWAHLGRHILGHVMDIPYFFLVILVLMAATHLLRRWPVTVGPGALLGALVIVRYSVEAMGVAPANAAAWSSTVGVLLCGFYLGGVGPRFGLITSRQLLIPALVVGWVWRFWVFLAAVLSAAFPFYKTHFFDPSTGHVGVRLAEFLGAGVVEGFLAGLLVWGIASWISRSIRPAVVT